MIIELKDKLNLESMIEGHGDAEMSLSFGLNMRLRTAR